MNTLSEYEISSFADKKNIGIWVGDKKIAAIGIKVKKWIAYHGFAINVNNDLSMLTTTFTMNVAPATQYEENKRLGTKIIQQKYS